MIRGRTLAAVGVVLAAAACGARGEPSGDPSPAGGDVPTTARALAAVAAEHTSRPRSAYLDDNAKQRVGKDAVGTDVRYRNADEQSDGDSLVVAVGTHPKGVTSCDHPPEWLAGCVSMSGGFLLWESEAPEEDPGVIEVVVPKGKATVLLVYSGPKITGDPRHLEMPITVDDLFAIARDPRVDLTTSQDAIDAGEQLDYWHD